MNSEHQYPPTEYSPCLVEYVWQDHNQNFRSKTRVLHDHSVKQDGIPMWNYDGSSTKQAEGSNSEVFLHPVKLCFDPFRRGDNAYIVLCDTWLVDKQESKLKDTLLYISHPDNSRARASLIFDTKEIQQEKPWFGLEQEFFFTKKQIVPGQKCNALTALSYETPLGMKTLDGKEWVSTSGKEQGDFYCGVGPNNVYGREAAEYIFNCLAFARHIKCTGYNWEVAPGQCEFQIFSTGIDAADSLLLFQYIAQRAAEQHNLSINFHPKPVDGDWNGSGCHVNFSTKSMRGPNSYDAFITPALKALKNNHSFHIKNYGADNKLRLTGRHETASWDSFTAGVGNRGASIRVPTQTYFDKSGYIEDRRPASNMDPYVVTSLLVNTVLLNGSELNFHAQVPMYKATEEHITADASV